MQNADFRMKKVSNCARVASFCNLQSGIANLQSDMIKDVSGGSALLFPRRSHCLDDYLPPAPPAAPCRGAVRGGLDPRRREALLERFDLDPTKKGRAYSKGNRQKVALVAALAAGVELLILDEPTSGLDPLGARWMKNLIVELRNQGKTVIMCSHRLEDEDDPPPPLSEQQMAGKCQQGES
jgi:hypothetical protein